MHLTPEQENDLIEELREPLERFAGAFCAKYNGGSPVDYDDAVQECVIVLLGHIRSVESMDKLAPLPFRDMHHAMCVHALGYLPVSVPRRTSNFTSMINSVQTGCSMEDLMEDGFDPEGGTENGYAEVDEKLSFDRFLRDLSDEDRMIVLCMMDARDATSASKALGMHKSTLSRKLAILKRKYLTDCIKIGGTAA